MENAGGKEHFQPWHFHIISPNALVLQVFFWNGMWKVIKVCILLNLQINIFKRKEDYWLWGKWIDFRFSRILHVEFWILAFFAILTNITSKKISDLKLLEQIFTLTIWRLYSLSWICWKFSSFDDESWVDVFYWNAKFHSFIVSTDILPMK